MERRKLQLPLHAGFTLLEMLVVISIIAVLASFLFPVYASSKREAVRASCQGNLHQIGLAFALYEGDYDDLYPGALDAFSKAYDLLPEPHPPMSDIPDLVSVLSPYTGGSKPSIWKCPADNLPFDATVEEVSAGSYPNVYSWAQTSYKFWPPLYFGRPASTITVGSNALRLGYDANDTWHAEYVDSTPFTKSVNSLFADGHVRFTPREGS